MCFIFRRGKRYSWRREVRGVSIQVSLGTSDRRVADAAGAAATAASVRAFEGLIERRLDRPAARAMIADAARVEVARQTLKGAPVFFFWTREMIERNMPESLDAYDRAISEMGETDAEAPPPPEPAAASEASAASTASASASSAPTIIIHNNITQAAPAEPRNPEPPAREPVPEPAPDVVVPFSFRGSAAPAPASSFALDPAPQPAAPRPAPVIVPVPEPEDGKARIMGLVPTINADELERGAVNDASARDFERTMALFVELSGVEYVEDVTQKHVHAFVRDHALIPKNYRKSQADRDKPIRDIMREAKDAGAEVGLSAATTNKNITNLSKFFKKAKTFGVRVSDTIDTSLLRVADKRKKKDLRLPFTTDEIRKIFEHRSLNLDAERDALFWIAHIAAYTGARREEIAGLGGDDVQEQDGVWFFHIRENDNRSLKNGQSERKIPLHKDLLTLGLHEYAKERRGRMLFDIRKKSAVSSFGDSIDYRWRKAMRETVGLIEGKTFHSFRHSAIDALKKAKVEERERGEIFGHLMGNIEDDVYGGYVELETLKEAIDLLPSVR